MASIEFEVSWCAGIMFLFLLPNWGHVAGRSESDLGGTVPLPVRTEMCVRRVVNKSGLTIQASLVIRDLTLRVFAITRFREKKAVRKLYSSFAVTVYGGGVTVWRAHQVVISYQYQCEREC